MFQGGIYLGRLMGAECDLAPDFTLSQSGQRQFDALMDEADRQVGGALVNAVGIGEKKASGPLCICRSTDEVAEKFQPGDVLVVPYTTNKLLPYIRQAAAVITEEASVECHTATIGLALDKPVIVGAAGAVQRLTDGTMVTVDCARGLVRAMP